MSQVFDTNHRVPSFKMSLSVKKPPGKSSGMSRYRHRYRRWLSLPVSRCHAIFLLVRLLLAILPAASGYIHPDEYFQVGENYLCLAFSVYAKINL